MGHSNLQKIIGSDITCKFSHVLLLPECNGQYGALAKTKAINSFVQNVVCDLSNPTSCVQTYIKSEFDLSNCHSKIVTVHLQFVQLKTEEVHVLLPTEVQVVEVIDNELQK